MTSTERRSHPRRMRVVLSALALGACLLVPGAQAAEILDQQQPTEGSGWVGVTSTKSAGQTFTAGVTGSLSRISLMLGVNSANTDLTVQIYDTSGGLPTGSPLATTTIPRSSVNVVGPVEDPLGWVNATFAAPPSIAAGHQYAIVLHTSSTTGHYRMGAADNLYSGGTTVAHNETGWFQMTAFDAAFKTYVVPVAPTAQFLDPLTQSTADGEVVNTAKNGRVVPVRMQVARDGSPLTGANTPGPVTLAVTDLGACDSGVGTDPVDVYAAGSANSGNAFRYDSAAEAWIYNLDTKAMSLASGNCYSISVLVNGVEAANAWAVLQTVR